MSSAESVYNWTLESGLNRYRNEGWGKEQVATERRTAAELFSDLEVPATEVGKLHDALVRHRLKPASDEERQKWKKESRKFLRENHDDADARLKAVRAYLDRRPALKHMLAETGLGDEPAFVERFAARAWTLERRPVKRNHGLRKEQHMAITTTGSGRSIVRPAGAIAPRCPPMSNECCFWPVLCT